ncbi:MAG TPA: hypothetical protein K8V00_09860 [Ligilactobacillus acidipiscis]|uniref:Uncharacterized protein n=1 Tax=Ligilactobacillus acidipiscis TaxID=89059 RepID=A0A921K2D5_9LACO|nr:hypothetical protein [Ligilactobacillus acidipiscis]
MTKYYRVRTQEQWDWLKNKLEIEDDLHVSDFPMTLLYGDVFCGIYKYHDDPEPLIEVSQMMEESKMEDYVTIHSEDLEKIKVDFGQTEDNSLINCDTEGEVYIRERFLPADLLIPKSLLYPKVRFTGEEKAEFDELKDDWQVLICAFDAINEIDYPRWFSRLNDYPDDNDEHQLDFARAWADPSLIEVIPEDKYWVKCYPTDDCYFYKYEGKILAGVPRVHLERFQFTTDEIVEYHLDGTENIFEKVEVSE